jgi:hypothetical protein
VLGGCVMSTLPHFGALPQGLESRRE